MTRYDLNGFSNKPSKRFRLVKETLSGKKEGKSVVAAVGFNHTTVISNCTPNVTQIEIILRNAVCLVMADRAKSLQDQAKAVSFQKEEKD